MNPPDRDDPDPVGGPPPGQRRRPASATAGATKAGGTKAGGTKAGAAKAGATKAGAAKTSATKAGATKVAGATKAGATKAGATKAAASGAGARPKAPARAPGTAKATSAAKAPAAPTAVPSHARPAPRPASPAPQSPPEPTPAATRPTGGRWEIPELPAEALRLADRVRKAAVVLLILGLCGFLIDGANRPANPYLLRTGPAGAGAGHDSLPAAGATGGAGTRSSSAPASGAAPAGASAGGAVGRPAAGTGLGSRGSITPPTLTPPGEGGAPPAALAGFPTATLSVLTAPGSTRTACVLEARTPAQQAQGLMNQTSLGRYAGMAFVFTQPSEARFYMKDTPMALSIAWFAGDGSFISSQTMPPCPRGSLSCPTYGPAVPYYLALEVPAGGLPGLGIGPGATVQVAGAC